MPDCNACKQDRKQGSVPYIVHEASMARMERTVKRLWILVIVAIALLVGSNLAWIVYEAQYVTEEATVEVDTGEGDAYVAGIGDVTIGESKGQEQVP